MNIKEEIQVYTLEDIRTSYGFNIQTLRRYIKEGKLNAKKVGKQYFVTKEEITRFFT